MKSMKNNYIILVILVIIIGSIGVVSAYTMLAGDISYTPDDPTWKKANGEDIANVQEAIDELYNKSNEKNCVHDVYVKQSNQQINISFDFEPSYFVAFFSPDASFATAVYENGVFSCSNNNGADMPYFQRNQNIVVTNFPASWNSYKASYSVYYIACK